MFEMAKTDISSFISKKVIYILLESPAYMYKRQIISVLYWLITKIDYKNHCYNCKIEFSLIWHNLWTLSFLRLPEKYYT